MVPSFKLYCKSILVKQYGINIKNWHIDQSNRIASLEINPYLYGQLIYDKGAKITIRKRRVSFFVIVGKSRQSHAKNEIEAQQKLTQNVLMTWM